MFDKIVIVDCKVMVSRLASVVAKEVLNGQRIVLVRAEEANLSGSYRHKVLWERF